MKILILGANGQVGWECQRSLSIMGELEVHDRTTAYFQNYDQLRNVVRKAKPDIILNAAAYTAVDQAETDSEVAFQVNADAVSVLAQEAKQLEACLVHFSTDYVFDGTKRGFYSEEDETSPQSVYGKSKRDGELAIIESGCHYFILRTSWVFATRGHNFAKTMLKLAQERDELRVVADQWGAPTSAELIADICALLVYQTRQQSDFAGRHSGIYNLAAAGETNWFEYAKAVLNIAKQSGLPLRVEPLDLVPVSTTEFPRPAPRPANSRLSTEKLTRLLNITMPKWQLHVEKMVAEILECQK